MAQFNFATGRSDFDWERAFFHQTEGLFRGNFIPDLNDSDVTFTSTTAITIEHTFTRNGNPVTYELVFTGTNLVNNGGQLDAGAQITGITLTETFPGTDTIFAISGIALNENAFNALIGADLGTDPARSAAYLDVFASEGTYFQGSIGGDNTYFGSSQADTFHLTGYGFNYVWTGNGTGVDTVYGSAAFDMIDLSGFDTTGFTPPGLIVDFAAGTVVDRDNGDDVVVFDGQIELIAGSNQDDIFNGSDNDDRAFGRGGDDAINGENGNDYLVGGAGDDTLDGGNGWDTAGYRHDEDIQTYGVIVNLTGSIIDQTGSGLAGDVDTAAFDAIVDGRTFSIDQNEGLDTQGTKDTYSDIEGYEGSINADMMLGGNGQQNHFEGRGGNDWLYGGNERDELFGEDGNDHIFGQEGQDYIRDGAGDDFVDAGDDDDYVDGGSGTNTIDGGSGHDQLAYHRALNYSGSFAFNFDGSNGSGTVTSISGATITDDDRDVDGGNVPDTVSTAFSHFERVTGTRNDDTFTVQTSFSTTDESDGGPDGARHIVVTGGDGADTFIDLNTSVPDSPTAYGTFRIDYGEEVWVRSDDDFNRDHRWGEWDGEYGVAINLGNAGGFLWNGKTVGSGTTVALNTARDTWGNVDTLTDGKMRSFQLTDAGDYVYAGNTGVDIRARDGNDTIIATGGKNFISGDEGDDYIVGGTGEDNLQGGRGKDTLDGGTGSGYNSLEYQWEQDQDKAFYVGNITVQFTGARSGVVVDTFGDLDTFLNIDTIRGTVRNDLFYGNGDDNLVEGLGGTDVFVGGGGTDTYSYESEYWVYRDFNNNMEPTHGVTVVLETANVNGSIQGYGRDMFAVGAFDSLDLLIDVENIIGSRLGDSITGSSVANWLEGREGNDSIYGGLGNDTLDGNNDNDYLQGDAGDDQIWGGNGHDTLRGGLGKDTMSGGDGNDWADYSDKTQKIKVTLDGDNQVSVFVNGTKATNVEDRIDRFENVIGGSGADTITGDGNDNWIRGGAGKDSLDGGAGLFDVADYSDKTKKVDVTLKGASNATVKVNNATEDTIKKFEGVAGGTAGDKLTGDTGNNLLFGNAGNDTIDGGTGSDTIFGGVGNDSLKGGTGADYFVFDTALNAATNVDKITDFSVVDDTIRLDDAIFAALGTGTLASNAFLSGAGAVVAANSDQRIIYNTSTGDLYYDADGNGGGASAIKFATLTTKPALTFADIEVV